MGSSSLGYEESSPCWVCCDVFKVYNFSYSYSNSHKLGELWMNYAAKIEVVTVVLCRALYDMIFSEISPLINVIKLSATGFLSS